MYRSPVEWHGDDLVDFLGQTKSVAEWAKLYDLPLMALHKLTSRHGGLLQALQALEDKLPLDYQFNDDTRTLGEWADFYHVPRDLFKKRLDLEGPHSVLLKLFAGWTIGDPQAFWSLPSPEAQPQNAA